MANLDNSLIGSVLNALPLDRMISIQAQTSASKSYADFLMGVCIQDGKAVSIQFDYDETMTDEQGVYQGTVSKKMQIPLIAAVTHPNIVIEEGNIEFELTISQQAESASETGGTARFGASLGWGPFKLDVKGQISHKSSQTRKTDTRARYAFNTKVRRQDPPEALQRVIDLLTDAATKPIMLPNTAVENIGRLPTDNALPMPDQANNPSSNA
ncbi:hypothetical protein CQ065_15825 [Pseudomonas sp. MYb187]|uniref:DUF2589 domain-containing protein n=1 Tax=Pseudomonas TaxID=286 RepID=UPI000CFB12E4|nr:DUF2589 domain-containing protein [Pseudomonas sp. MYb187]PRA62489.1 hypothetical protein CQ065_15825 [Pseudomonas sp. MYb187]